jgi:hypothetical protein
MKIDITTAAMLGSLNISVWEARIQDKRTKDEVLANKGAKSKKAASVSKNLFSECPELEAIKALRSEARVWFNSHTLPWDDNGNRLITTRQYLDVVGKAAEYETKFDGLVRAFVSTYSTAISKQAFEMGSLFDRSEYPLADEVAAKFRFGLSLSPLPSSGDFRVDIGHEAQRVLAEQYERATAERVAGAVQDTWNRVRDQVSWVRERMEAVLSYNPDEIEEVPTTDDTGTVVSVEIKKRRRPKLYDSMLEQGLELCKMLSDLNVTNDPRLEEARRDLERALTRVDMDSLKESPELQRATKQAMDDILDKFAL